MTFSVYKSLGEFSGDFDYGSTDCCQLARHVVLDRTGLDFGVAFNYDDEEGAEALLRKHGGVAGVVSHALGFEPSDNFHESDPVFVVIRGVESIGIVVRNSVACCTAHGLIQVNPKFIVSGWCLCQAQ